MAFWLRRAPAPPDLGELAASPNRDVCRWEVWIGFEAVERLGIWSCIEGMEGMERLTVRYGTARSSTVQHGTTRSTLDGAPESLPISSHSGGSPRSSLTSRFSPIISHLSPLTSHLPIFRQTAAPPRRRPRRTFLFSPLFPPYSQLLGAAPRTTFSDAASKSLSILWYIPVQ